VCSSEDLRRGTGVHVSGGREGRQEDLTLEECAPAEAKTRCWPEPEGCTRAVSSPGQPTPSQWSEPAVLALRARLRSTCRQSDLSSRSAPAAGIAAVQCLKFGTLPEVWDAVIRQRGGTRG